MPFSVLSTRRINRALHRLAELAAADKRVLEIALCHGQIITVLYSTACDSQAVGKSVESSARAAELIRQVAKEQRLPADWLAEDVKFHLALAAARGHANLDDFGSSMVLSMAEPAHLLAMKVHLCQRESRPALADCHDLAFLMEKAGLESLDAVEGAYTRFFPGHKLADDARALVGRLLPVGV